MHVKPIFPVHPKDQTIITQLLSICKTVEYNTYYQRFIYNPQQSYGLPIGAEYLLDQAHNIPKRIFKLSCYFDPSLPFSEQQANEIMDLVAQLPFLWLLDLNDFPAPKLSQFPPQVHRLHIENSPLLNFLDWQIDFSNLRYIAIGDCPRLYSLHGFPAAPHLETLAVDECPLRTLRGIPALPALKRIVLRDTKLMNYDRIDFLRTHGQQPVLVNIIPDPFISLYGLPPSELKTDEQIEMYLDEVVRHSSRYTNPHPQSYLPYFDQARYTLQEIVAHFAPSPEDLAQKYVQNPTSLTPFERDRILYEGTLETIQLLHQTLSSWDPLLEELAERWHVELEMGQILK